jgi:hypothetical protein
MEGFLTKEEAKVAQLSRNPLKRHRQVKEQFDALNGIGIDVVVNPRSPVHREKGRATIIVNKFAPLLGRKALVNMAEAVEVISRPEGDS